jgi:hypothetical protein
VETPLLDCETRLMRVHRHWALLLKWAWGPAVMVLLAIVLNLTLDFLLGMYYQTLGAQEGLPDPRLSPVLPDLRLAVTLLLLAVAGLWLTTIWLNWSSLILTVTDYRVIRDIGIGSHVSGVIGLDRVLDVSTYQTAMGGLLNYGTIKINGQDQSLDYIPDPRRVAEKIFVQVQIFKRGGAGPKAGMQELQEEASEAEAEAQAGPDARPHGDQTHTT